jgi:hypothetical protein
MKRSNGKGNLAVTSHITKRPFKQISYLVAVCYIAAVQTKKFEWTTEPEKKNIYLLKHVYLVNALCEIVCFKFLC